MGRRAELPPGIESDLRLVGRRIRHERRARRLTLAELASAVGSSPSHLSQVENGRRQPTLRLLAAIAAAFRLSADELLRPEPPSRRAALEIAVEEAQAEPMYRALGLPPLRPGRRVPTAALEHISGLYDALRRRSERSASTPEEARTANRQLRDEMREQGNYFPAVEAHAARILDAVGYGGTGALSQRVLLDIAAHCGFRLRYMRDLPRSVRSVADLRNRRIYLTQGSWTGGHDTRSVLLQTLATFVLGHGTPAGFADYLRRRTEANYFAAAVLVPERAAVPLLRHAKEDRSLAVEDVRDVFSVSYEMAAHRFTNLATRHLDLPVHFVRTDEDGRIHKAYENDGVVFPADADGAIEGQRVCRQWAARRVFRSARSYPGLEQYTDTPTGTYWCSSRDVGEGFAVTVGVPFRESKWFRGRETTERRTSRCPDPSCCARPPADLAARWDRLAWPSARAQSHVLAVLPPGVFPGVDLTEVYEFLDRHAADAGDP
ncbi:XRE family transcriptional regulator [Dactylosporangium fulvum]|uniref:Helix-turn-helix domain-containing protein n=1 Tax=Dactylosporangium fulvum TaxID=53359 RepID=A0ABY5VQF9_9ACTN|nr:XRE family transcriptional regulator [Dactylosporangium fulvum]UWP79049.1 helix-turn-helix domain-containing protein [Dactylosporangium fulvum]